MLSILINIYLRTIMFDYDKLPVEGRFYTQPFHHTPMNLQRLHKPINAPIRHKNAPLWVYQNEAYEKQYYFLELALALALFVLAI